MSGIPDCYPNQFLTAPATSLDLSAAVDVYSDWVDACDAVAKDAANQYEGAAGSTGNRSDALAGAGHRDTYDDDDDY